MASCLLADVYSAGRTIIVATALFLIVGCSSESARPKSTATPIRSQVEVLSRLPDTAPIPSARTIDDALSPFIHSSALGDHVGVAVADVRSGRIIYESSSISSADQFIPASAIKLFTITAVLLKNRPEEMVRFKGKNLSLSNLVEITLTESDNSGANLLSTLVPGSLSKEISDALPTLDLSRTTLADASGLSRTDRTTPATLAHLLVAIADPKYPQLSPILSGLPISGLSGTLESRILAASGQVRAKTGTLTGVDVLAGYVVDKAKRALAFAIMADHVPETEPGRRVIDKITVSLLNLS